ncbi:MAG: asparaginase [Sulfurospirillum sp.]|nr:asparaginase [Sulfurospirillum sp.]MBL0703307.1 asparaginase [Sulfurospirillum sp.]
MLIINTGGTFNKKYNSLKGELEVSKDLQSLEKILKYFYNLEYKIKNIIHKDSLDIKLNDRKKIVEIIKNVSDNKILIIHGTDTMNETAKFIAQHVDNKTILLTGAMIPFSIDNIEANANFSMSIGYLLSSCQNGIYISMHGLIDIHNRVFKNREIGIFQSST